MNIKRLELITPAQIIPPPSPESKKPYPMFPKIINKIIETRREYDAQRRRRKKKKGEAKQN